MLAPMKLPHIRMIAISIVLVGAFLFLSMIYIAIKNGALLTGIQLEVFTAGLMAGSLIMSLGAVLFVRPTLGQLGTCR
ncbi:MAG: hypothetical protein GKR90_00090 [Pseudomonadales bacterium]|nr:hypothetical protein [Pseudomonadales bacterium]